MFDATATSREKQRTTTPEEDNDARGGARPDWLRTSSGQTLTVAIARGHRLQDRNNSAQHRYPFPVLENKQCYCRCKVAHVRQLGKAERNTKHTSPMPPVSMLSVVANPRLHKTLFIFPAPSIRDASLYNIDFGGLGGRLLLLRSTMPLRTSVAVSATHCLFFQHRTAIILGYT